MPTPNPKKEPSMDNLTRKSFGKRPAFSQGHQEVILLDTTDSEAGGAGWAGINKLGTGGEEHEAEDDDDFEEVPMPVSTGISTVSIGTAFAESTPINDTPTSLPQAMGGDRTPGNLVADSESDGYGEYHDDEDNESTPEEDAIRVEIGGETAESKAKRLALALRKRPMTSKDRALRLESHKIHLIALLASARIRNAWANNLLLKCRLLSLLPHPLVVAFNIPPSRFPDRAQRSRLFLEALQSLVTWWSQSFFDVSDPYQGLRTRSWDEIQYIIDKLPRIQRTDLFPSQLVVDTSDKSPQKFIETRLEAVAEGAHGERLRSVNSLMKRALLQEGSRDSSAILFVSVCRACGLGTRLVVSLQAVPWRAEKATHKKASGGAKRKGSGGEVEQDESEEDSMEEVAIPGLTDIGSGRRGGPGRGVIRKAGRRRHQDPADAYRLKNPKPSSARLGAESVLPIPKKAQRNLDLSKQPPVMWAEVFSRSDQRWIPVDTVRGTIRKKSHFEPVGDGGPVRMTYVMAFEEDGFARDVTLRYTKSFGAKTSKLRVPVKKDEPDWWQRVLDVLSRGYRLHRDELEDAELQTSQFSETMPVHLQGFKDHPIFVLVRHLKREEVIHPKREVGKFRGEPVYRRSNVHACKTAETWMRVGRKVKDKQDPLKWVKQRAVTLQRKREVEMAKQDGEEQLQGLYAEWQTEVYMPPPIQNGQIPKNAFGNLDLYVPTMLPQGATHLPYKGVVKVAKQLGISYAEACTGFEFKKQRALPVITGIVVAEDQAEIVMSAFRQSATAAEERERRKREEKALKRWAKLINAMRVRGRLRGEYGNKEGLHDTSHNPLADATENPQRAFNTAEVLASAQREAGRKWADRQHSCSPTPSRSSFQAGRHRQGSSVSLSRTADTSPELEPQNKAVLPARRDRPRSPSLDPNIKQQPHMTVASDDNRSDAGSECDAGLAASLIAPTPSTVCSLERDDIPPRPSAMSAAPRSRSPEDIGRAIAVIRREKRISTAISATGEAIEARRDPRFTRVLPGRQARSKGSTLVDDEDEGSSDNNRQESLRAGGGADEEVVKEGWNEDEEARIEDKERGSSRPVPRRVRLRVGGIVPQTPVRNGVVGSVVQDEGRITRSKRKR